MDFSDWRRHFEDNAKRGAPATIAAPALDEGLKAALGQTLGVFFLGESGEGRIAHEIDRFVHDGIDEDYRASLKRFVAEEGRHASLLAKMITGLGSEIPRGNWTEGMFRGARRSMGVRSKMLVLTAAEVVSLCFYAALMRGLPGGEMGEVLDQIWHDEVDHLRFHVDFFRVVTRGRAGKAAFKLGWWSIVTGAVLAVLADHRGTLGLFGASSLRILDEARLAGGIVERAVCEGRDDEWALLESFLEGAKPVALRAAA